MRDDGYDISDYRNIQSRLRQSQRCAQLHSRAHRRGLKGHPQTLVINHTSDQHPWFRRRASAAGSKKRDFYLWSDSDEFPETRIIFTDTEESQTGPGTKSRRLTTGTVFSHQPDLNHNNPEVVKAVIRVMRFWLDIEVDGLRLDAIATCACGKVK